MNKKIILSLLLALTLIPGIHAGKIITETLHSNILDADRDVNVYLPTGYDESGSTQYPVLYLLHGLSDDQTAWAQRGGLQTVADELILTGEMRPMVIIMPCAGGMPTTEIWNGYYNMPGWAYERFFFEELIPQIEKKFHIYGDKAHRAISGLSMGGGGSVGYCQKHPDMFSSCYAFSAWL
ncbi:MAG: esterase family protein, partial [Bacteroidaceae bacterium]|nr:esterase family protein [Bacteroidaceae bacterium]